ncbi:helix-turn-helix domain-containing protein [Maribacter chungangensis]|uniref:Helix-turn-helix domain-containing protein n=1 Tax=Maribacter chungangensis TaxID=1069117 RepID=A0ABW3B181_9FLAO
MSYLKRYKFIRNSHLKYFRILKNIVFLCVLFLVQNLVQSQQEKNEQLSYPDSIRKYFPTDSAKTKILISDYISKSLQDNNPEDLFDSYHALASFYHKHKDTIRYIEYTDSLFSVAKNNNLKIELLKGYHLKNLYLRLIYGLDDPRIFDNIYNALQVSKEINSKIWECKFNRDIAEYYQLTREYDKALLFYKNNLSILKQITKSQDYHKFKIWGSSIETTNLEISKIYIELKEIDSARLYNNIAKSVLDTTEGNYHDVYRFRQKIQELEINLLENDVQLAKEHFDEAYKIVPDFYQKSDIDFTKDYYSGLISYQEGNFQEAIVFFEALDTVRIKSNERLGFFHNDLYKKLYKSFLRTNNLTKADYYFEKHLSSIRGQMDVNNSVNSNFKKTEIDQYNIEVETLKKQKAKQWYVLLASFMASTLIICLLIVRFRKQQAKSKEKLRLLLNQISKNETQLKPKVAPLNINDDEMKRIIEKINELEDKKYYLRMDLTASSLAKKLKTNTTYLSKIINIHYQKKFTTYINDLRIDYVIDRLKNDNLYRRYTIHSLANEVGFKSKESFNAAFKKRTGVLPSALIKELAKKSKQYQS